MSAEIVVGLDVGSTYVKALAVTVEGDEVCGARRPTPWTDLGHGRTQMDPAVLLESVRDLLGELVENLRRRDGDGPVTAVGVSGMAEAGVLLDRDDNAVIPILAWFDPRGDEEVEALPTELRREFTRRTGLPSGPLATFAKLLHHRASGLDLAGLQWLSVPEYVVWALGGDRAAEVSLSARTGLVDQDTGEVWPTAVERLGVDASLLPPVRTAGSSWGRASRLVEPELSGAVLTVAGHDHLVASVSAGVLQPDQLYDSMGTAEALVRVLDGPLDADARQRLADHEINVLRHLLPGRGVMLAGTKSGLLMRRVLQLVGVSDAAGRAALDEAVMQLPDGGGATADALSVTGAYNDDGVLQVRADGDGLSPAALFAATLAHGGALLRDVVARMDAEVPPASETLVAGGWTGMASVRRSRSAVLPSVQYAAREESTGYGAAVVAAFAADTTTTDLADHLARFGAHDPSTSEGQHR
ncbi:FGGY-family carbohydrate kinase [Solicola sp. PLA-1-18]|uniref:FGGY-family carbohydrate kinase n=1 Tax=Solicola sp. PLA-1-18 TaxID=3380532 RepID=UPI003B772618